MVEKVYNHFEVIILSIGEQIKKARKEKGLTQKQLAEKLNIATNSLSRYEIGERTPDNETIVRIAKALDVAPSSLLIDVIKDSFDTLNNFNPTTLGMLQEPSTDEETKNTAAAYRIYIEKLNNLGREKANEYIADLLKIDKYTKPDNED